MPEISSLCDLDEWRIMKQLVTNWRYKLTKCLHWDELSYDPFTVISRSTSNLKLVWTVAHVDKKVRENTIYWDHKVPICCQDLWAGALSLDRRTFSRRTQRILESVSESFFHTLWSSIESEVLTLRWLMSYIYIYIYIYIYGAPILDVSRSHTTTQHSR